MTSFSLQFSFFRIHSGPISGYNGLHPLSGAFTVLTRWLSPRE